MNWLKEYIDLSNTAEEIAEMLTDCGLEVEGLEDFESIHGSLKGLVIGKVIECKAHPNADRLKLTKVDIGYGEALSIVCGAPNVSMGQKVVVATVGCTLYPTEGEPFQIKKSKIRSEVSEGMICAEDEIGLGRSHEGIMVLPDSAKIGTAASEYFEIHSDKVFEIGLTPNRADATSHFGVARDLSAVLNLKTKVELRKASVDAFKVDNNSSGIQLEVKDTIACPRYSGLSISDIEVKDSPEWLQLKLKAIGVKPINNIVDVTNYVLHEIGQPLHAFDADKIKGEKVVVQTLAGNTEFTTLDEKSRKLHSDDLMICHEVGPMCMAGIFGGLSSGVSKATKNIFIESAYFNPVNIRKAAKRHALNTDASFRYERGADPEITIYALKRAALLIKEVAGGKVSSEILDVYPHKIEEAVVNFKYANCTKLVGQEIEKSSIKSIFKHLEIKILEENEEGLKLSVPAYRVDVTREVDLIEEVLRIYGYNQIKLPEFLKTSLSFSNIQSAQQVENAIANFLASNSFYEIFNNSLTNPAYYENQDDLVHILNPLSSELQVMRQSLVFGGLEAIRYNKNRKKDNLCFFEFGKSYFKIPSEGGYVERKNLALFMTGMTNADNWEKKAQQQDYYSLKRNVHSIFERLGIFASFKIEEVSNKLFAYSQKYTLGKNELLKFGLLQPALLKKFDIKSEVYFAEFNWDNVLKMIPTSDVKFKAVSKYPFVRRDLALLLDKEIEFETIESIARKTEKKLLREIDLFDVYEGKNLPEGKKSYAVSFTFQDENSTLTDAIIDGMMDKLIGNLKKKLKVELR